jgi:hypothetical protein
VVSSLASKRVWLLRSRARPRRNAPKLAPGRLARRIRHRSFVLHGEWNDLALDELEQRMGVHSQTVRPDTLTDSANYLNY